MANAGADMNWEPDRERGSSRVLHGTTVVIPVRNSARTLPRCLAALRDLDPRPQEFVLVDNGSTDASLEMLRAFARENDAGDVHVIEEARRGPSAARNAGVRAAKGELIIFTDSDCAPERDWVARMTEPFADAGIGAVAGRVIGAPDVSPVAVFSALYTLRLPERPDRVSRWTPRRGGFPTANLAIRRELFERLGGFDEGMMTGEDHDLCARLYALGGVLDYVPAARVWHHHRTTWGGMVRQAFGFGRGQADLLHRHTRGGLWLDLPGMTFAWSRWPVRWWVDLASADKKVLAIVLLGGAHRALFLLLPVYFLWLARSTRQRAAECDLTASVGKSFGLAGLLVCKSLAMTLGRWWGSLRYGVVCF